MLKKQSKILKQESKKVSKVSKSLLKKVGVTQKKKAKTEALPTHQFKNVKVKGIIRLGTIRRREY
jgi:hypothetical protein